MQPVVPATLKQAIRKQTQALREQLPPEERAACDAVIVQRLLQLPEYRQADAVLGYMNFGAEFASELWAAQVLSAGKRLALPKVNRHTNRLDLYWVEDAESQLAPGLWGIREPVVERCKRLSGLNEVEFALLPGVAFTRRGERLGYGGGYYDRLLAQDHAETHRPVLAAAAYGLQVVDYLPQEATDVRVAWIITEHESMLCLT